MFDSNCQEIFNSLINLDSIEKVLLFDSIDSTNLEAQRMLESNPGKIGNTIIIADSQSGGRGRRDNNWISPDGGIYFSYILDGDYPPLLSLIIGLSVREAIYEIRGIETLVKWPNDILWRNKKISGILLNKQNDHIVVGVGINTFSVDKLSLWNTATLDMPDCHERMILISTIISRLMNNIHIFETDGFDILKSKIMMNLAFLEKEVILLRGDTRAKGILKGISSHGEVIIEIDGQKKNFSSGSLILNN